MLLFQIEKRRKCLFGQGEHPANAESLEERGLVVLWKLQPSEHPLFGDFAEPLQPQHRDSAAPRGPRSELSRLRLHNKLQWRGWKILVVRVTLPRLVRIGVDRLDGRRILRRFLRYRASGGQLAARFQQADQWAPLLSEQEQGEDGGEVDIAQGPGDPAVVPQSVVVPT
jgi:hypothetical protein